MKEGSIEIPVSKDNLSIEKDQSKCIECGYCVNVCRDEVTVARMYDIDKTIEPICINCGQCANVCPSRAITEKIEYLQIKEKIKNNSINVVSIAPSVRVAIGEEFGLDSGINVEKKIITALRKLGFNYVFDITFGADLTIMEEAQELVNRIKNNGTLPMFTSCCPAWVKYAEIFYPELIPNLSSCKSPIAMQGTMIKTYFAKNENINPKDILNVVVAPCTAKKTEIKRKELNSASTFNQIDEIQDNDYVMTTRELALLLKEENINLLELEDGTFDNLLGKGSSAGLIFGNSGGVCESALRTVYYNLTGENLPKDAISFQIARGMKGIKEVSITVGGITLKAAIVNGMKNAKELLDKVLKKEVDYQFIEIMSCSGGCIFGGGQPIPNFIKTAEVRMKRMDGIYGEDDKSQKRFCHENPQIKKIYADFLERPNSEIAEKLLHTSYIDKSSILKNNERR